MYGVADTMSFLFRRPLWFPVFLSLLFTACNNDLNDLPKENISVIQHDRAEKVRFIFSREGQVQASLAGDSFLQNNEAVPPFVDLKRNLKLTFYDDSLGVESTLTAQYARYYPQTGNVIVRDQVCVINKKGEKLETEELIWNQKIERFYSEKQVVITKDGQMTYGDGLEANQDFSWFRIKNQRGVVPVDKGGLPLE